MGKKLGKKSENKSDVEVAVTPDRKSGTEGKRKGEDDTDTKKALKKSGKKSEKKSEKKSDIEVALTPDRKSGTEGKINGEDYTDTKKALKKSGKKSKKKSGVEVALTPDRKSGTKGEREGEDDTDTKKPLKKQKSSDLKPGKRNLEELTTKLLKAKKQLPPEEVESSGSDDESSGSKKRKPNASSSEATQRNTFFVAKPNSLIVGNLSDSVDKKTLQKFFQRAGEIVETRLATFSDGTCRGYAQVEFATPEAVHEACKWNGHILMGRAVKLNLGHERATFNNPDSCSFKKPTNFSSNTVLVKGFDAARRVEQIDWSMQNLFSSYKCDVAVTSIPTDDETGASKGVLFMQFENQISLLNALKLNGSDIGGGRKLHVEVAEPDRDPVPR